MTEISHHARPQVGVIGPGSLEGERPELDGWAEEIGRGLVRCGAVIICGGLGGVMEAVARGAREEGGVCVGLLPGADRAEGNRFLSLALPTALGEMRNALVVRASDLLVAVGRGHGTLSEIALALRARKHVIGLSTWPVEPAPATLHTVASPGEALDLAGRLMAG